MGVCACVHVCEHVCECVSVCGYVRMDTVIHGNQKKASDLELVPGEYEML